VQVRIVNDFRFAPPVQSYLYALVQLCTHDAASVISIVFFGSAVKGGFSTGVSDVDTIIVLADRATPQDGQRLLEHVRSLEVSHGLRPPAVRPKTPLETFAERAGGNALSCFVCTRGELLAGDVARVFGLRRAEAAFVDRIVFANIIVSAVTVWGEDLLPQIPLPPIRRLDVIKALFAFLNLLLLSAVTFPLLPDATTYAAGTLKRSLHSCFFCYQRRSASLEEEIAFFNRHLGADPTFANLLVLRRQPRRSFAFVLHSLPTVARLHWRTARDNAFPLKVFRS
jgi:hypothetical protein